MREEIKKENRRALPKFFLVLLGAMVFGGVMGTLGFTAGRLGAADAAAEALVSLLRAGMLWGIPLATLALAGPGWWLYFSARKGYRGWDGEDEAVIDRVEVRLSWALLLTAPAMALDMFFLTAASIYSAGAVVFGVLGELAVSCGVLVVLQQKVVDLEKEINPEKRGSVYERHFQKTWMDSCDESEQRQIGMAAYKAQKATMYTCLALWLGLTILDNALSVGLLPMAVVLVIFGVSQTSYALECIRLQKADRNR